MSTRFSDSSRRRWPLGLALVLVVVITGAVLAALLNSRSIQGAVPGTSAVLGMATDGSTFLVGTADGMYKSSDGRVWERVSGFGGPVLIAPREVGSVVLTGGRLYFDVAAGEQPVSVDVPAGTAAVAAGPDVYLASGSGSFYKLESQRLGRIESSGGPDEVLALAARGEELLAGGLSSGLWRSQDGALSWTKILGTPVRAALLERGGAGRGFIATAGGVLSSADGRAWEFTGLRQPVEALCQSEGAFWAITSDRLIYKSGDGETWEALAGP